MPLHSPSPMLHQPIWHRRWGWLWAGLMLVVGVLALTPGDAALAMGSSDKLNHLLAFAALAATGALATRGVPSAWLKLSVGLLIYGGLIELAQRHVPGRSGDWADVLADGVGVSLGLGVVVLLRRGWQQRAS